MTANGKNKYLEREDGDQISRMSFIAGPFDLSEDHVGSFHLHLEA